MLVLGQTLVSQDIQSSTKGVSATANGIYSGWSSDSFFLGRLAEEEPAGTGFNLGVGYGFNQQFSAHVQYAYLDFSTDVLWDKFAVTSINLSGRMTFGATLRAIRPYIGAGITSVSMKVDPVTFDNFGEFELVNSGIGFLFNGGVDYFILPNLAIGFYGEFSSGSFSNISLSGERVDVDESIDFSFFNINLGVRYYFE